MIRNGIEISSNVVASQIESHKRFGGVVPELASRQHVDQITIVISEALEKADVTFNEIDAVAVTKGPGLVGALLVGVNAAKALALSYQIPLVGVHHIAGHIYANRLPEAQIMALRALELLGLAEASGMRQRGALEQHRIGSIGAGPPGAPDKVLQQIDRIRRVFVDFLISHFGFQNNIHNETVRQ